MQKFPHFLSVVLVIRNQSSRLQAMLEEVAAIVAPRVADYELIVVENASRDDSISELKRLTGESGLANLQVYALTKAVDADTAPWVGLENALGDYVAVINPQEDDIQCLPAMLDKALEGADVVFMRNRKTPDQGFAYRVARGAFNRLYRWCNGIDLARDAPKYRLISKKVVNFILQHPQPVVTYRHLPASGGFHRVILDTDSGACGRKRNDLSGSIDRGMRLLTSTTRAPMRLVTSLSLLGAIGNLLYSFYVMGVGLFKDIVEPGWVSLSLQQSGMFFLISLVLFVIGEYVLHMTSASSEGPPYHLAQEFTSARISRREKLNVEEVTPPSPATVIVDRAAG